MRLNVKKTKELRVFFFKEDSSLDNLSANNNPADIVTHFKLLGVIVSSDLTWNRHVDDVCAKVSKHLYSIRILKRSGISTYDLVLVYRTSVRPVLECACQVRYFSLTEKLINQVEQVQRRALKIIHPHLSYSESLDVLKLRTLYDRRQKLCYKMFRSILHPSNKLNDLLRLPKEHLYFQDTLLFLNVELIDF